MTQPSEKLGAMTPRELCCLWMWDLFLHDFNVRNWGSRLVKSKVPKTVSVMLRQRIPGEIE